MKLLILGGTRFLGHHIAAAARARGHELTLFHRRKHGLAVDRDIETITGDRNLDLSKLRGRQWEAVIDTCGYFPDSVRASAEALAESVERYVFISTVSVYADFSECGMNESSPVVTLSDDDVNRARTIDASGPVSAATYGSLYGGLKVLCERAAEEVLPGRVLSVRPGVIVGPYDYTDRLTWWVARVARGGEVLAPGRPGRHLQFIDVRDLSEWVVAAIEQRQAGLFNATGPAETVTMAGLLETCRTISGSDARFTWASEQFLLDEQVTPWTEMPLWLPEEALPRKRGFMAISSQKALDAGLRDRSLDETVGDLHRWHAGEPQGRTLHAGLPPDREQQLLERWHSVRDVC
ncbi:MAG TPA: NAD-dependent epimerase/dehydratase family protein [Thermoanaerobaculia bacterium]|jgi:2'-hydroxyisoflavone reductase